MSGAIEDPVKNACREKGRMDNRTGPGELTGSAGSMDNMTEVKIQKGTLMEEAKQRKRVRDKSKHLTVIQTLARA